MIILPTYNIIIPKIILIYKILFKIIIVVINKNRITNVMPTNGCLGGKHLDSHKEENTCSNPGGRYSIWMIAKKQWLIPYSKQSTDY